MSRWRGRLFEALPPPLQPAAFRVWERLAALRTGADQPDLPPPYLRVLTAGDTRPEAFSALGERAADQIRRLAGSHGEPLDGSQAVLEFGVGCGRVAVWMTRRSPVLDFHGCDINPQLLAWSRAHLPGRYDLTRLEPPLPYAGDRFDLVYALSVFTHLHQPQARAWLAELARVTRRDGLAILSYHDERLAQAAPLAERLSADGFAVLREGDEGSNLLSVYFTAAGLADHAAPHWRLEESVASDASGVGQALAVFRRT